MIIFFRLVLLMNKKPLCDVISYENLRIEIGQVR